MAEFRCNACRRLHVRTCHSDTRTAIASFCMGLQVNVPCCADCCLLLTVCMSSRGAFELAVPMILMLAHCIRNSNVYDILKRQCVMHACMVRFCTCVDRG